MRIIGTLTVINSKRDRNGNCYWAFRFLDHETGREVRGTGDTGSNIESAARWWFNDGAGKVDFLKNGNSGCQKVNIVRQEIGIRDFNALVKEWPYAGCGGDDVAAWIKKELADLDTAVLP
jgi:hypothetical protein